MLELNSLTKWFGKSLGISNVEIACEEREFLVLFGPAGAGKTTILRLIAGVLEPTSGEVRFRGQSLTGVPPEHRNMSMAFENYALYSHLTVYENLAFPLRARGYSIDQMEQAVHGMASLLQISEQLDRRPGFLSGGQRQRVALGRALIRGADVYLLDEPIAHLDAKLRHHMRSELKALCAEKDATIVHATTECREAVALGDRVAVLNRGQVMQLGTPDEIFHRPANEFVANFVGNPPMSLLDAEYVEEEGEPGFRLSGNGVRLPADREVAVYVKKKGLPDRFRLSVRASETSIASTETETHKVAGEVYVTEMVGHRRLVIVEVGDDLIRVVTPLDQKPQVGETVWVNLDQENLHVFADGAAVAHPRPERGESHASTRGDS